MAFESAGVLLTLSVNLNKCCDKCIICGKVKDISGSKKLTSTEEGRAKIKDASVILQDGLLDGTSEAQLCKIKYHVKLCKSLYIVKTTIREDASERRREENPAKERPKRAKLIPSPIACKEKPCIICNQSKYIRGILRDGVCVKK